MTELPKRDWPDDVAELYRESAEEDRSIAEVFCKISRETWPNDYANSGRGGIMSTVVTTDRMTVQQFNEFCLRPENQGRQLELEDGRVIEMSRPGERHGAYCWVIGVVLGMYLYPRGLGHVCTNDTGMITSQTKANVRGPDLVVFLDPPSSTELSTEWIDRTPALVIEVLSPNDRPNQIEKRVTDYIRRGAPQVWIVDPQDRTVSVRQPNELPRVLDDTDELTGNGVLPDFRCKVADLFRLPGQT